MSNLLPHRTHLLQRMGKGDPAKMDRYVLMFAAFLEGYGVNTRTTYTCSLKQFFELFDWISPEDVTLAHASAFKKWLIERKGVSEATAYYRICALKSFFDFLCRPTSAIDEPLIKYNPFSALPRHDIQPTPYARAKALDWATFEKLLGSIPADPTGLRDKAILLFFAYTGRRRSEVADLRVRDLNLSSPPFSYTVRVKGGRIREFELPGICWEAIKAYWLAADRLDSITPDSGVFVAANRHGFNRGRDPENPLSNRMMNYILDRAAKRAGLARQRGIYLHALRHMAARDLDRAQVPLQDIQAFLGHASPTTTQVYLDKLSGPVSAHETTLRKVREAARQVARESRD